MYGRVFISIGSNIADRRANCKRAIELVSTLCDTILVRKSRLYETGPWGGVSQRRFVNCAVEARTELPPDELLSALKAIESRMGRADGRRWGPRVIDLDIIFYGDRVISKKGIEIPHPGLAERAFVLAPLEEIAPRMRHPVTGKTVTSMLSRLRGADVKAIQG